MLRVLRPSGEEVLGLPAEEVRDVRTLKQRLHEATGPRQRRSVPLTTEAKVCGGFF